MKTLIGQILDELGHAHQVTTRAVPAAPRTGRNFDVETRTTVRAQPAHNLRTRQAERIPVNIAHDRQAEIGRVLHLELRGRHLWAIAEIDHDFEGPWRFSVETSSSYQAGSLTGTDIEITGIGLVARSAQTNLAPVTILDGGLDHKGSWSLKDPEKTLVQNAADVLHDRRAGRPIQVRGLLDEGQQQAAWAAADAADSYRAGARHAPPRSAGQLEHSPWRGRILRVS